MSANRTTPYVHLRSEHSGGAVSVIETTPGPGPGPPLHHHDFDEAFYVIEGELTFRLRDDTVIAGPGNLVFAPRIAAENTGEQPPVWAQQPIPEVTRVGPPLTELAGGGS